VGIRLRAADEPAEVPRRGEQRPGVVARKAPVAPRAERCGAVQGRHQPKGPAVRTPLHARQLPAAPGPETGGFAGPTLGNRSTAMDELGRERRLERRTGRRMVVGGVVGAVIGAALGLLVGAFVVDPWTPAHWAMALGGVILGGGIAMVQGGLTGLEAVDPGAEPSSMDDPIRDESGWTSPERDARNDHET